MKTSLLKYEQGRSMVEMLGVLAVMGVLSIAGIAGYNNAMNRHHANTIIEEAKMHSVLLSGQALLKGLPETTNLENLRYPFTYHKESEWGYSLNLAGLEKGVCQILQGQRNLGWAETVLINDGADCKESNQVAFYINTGMTTDITNEDRVVSCESDEDCGECGSCSLEQKLCVFDDFYCTDPDKPYCNKGVCQSCEVGKFKANDGKCYQCDDKRDAVGISDPEEVRAKCQGIRYVSYSEGFASLCSSTVDWFHANSFRSDCFTCPKRYMVGTAEKSTCFYCEGIMSDNRTACKTECGKNRFYSGSLCYDCDDSRALFSPVNSEQIRKECQGIRFLSWEEGASGGAHRCDYKEELADWIKYTERSDCLSCPQRYMEGTARRGRCLWCDGTVSSDGTSCTPVSP